MTHFVEVLKPVILTRDNYNQWCVQVRRKIKLDPHAWALVEDGYEVPKLPPNAQGDVLNKPLSDWTQHEVRDDISNTKALKTIHENMDMNMFQMIKDHTTTQDACEALRRFFVGSSKDRESKI